MAHARPNLPPRVNAGRALPPEKRSVAASLSTSARNAPAGEPRSGHAAAVMTGE